MPTSILITGGAGFLGINLTRYLLGKGQRVTVFDIAPFDYDDVRDQVKVIAGDVRDRAAAENYLVYLFAGMVPWGFLAGCLNDCSFCIIHNEGLIRKIYLPKLVFPLAKVLVNLTTFVLSMAALFILLVPLGATFSPALLLLPVVTLLFCAFTLGLGLMVATANTFFRDCGHLVAVFLQAWYFATPIIYELKLFPEELRWRFWLNPAYPFIKMFQEIIRDGRLPHWPTFLIAVGVAATTLGIGYATFKSQEDKLVFRL